MAKKFTSDNFEAEVLKADKPVFVDFYADWCSPCKMMAPVVDQLAEQYEGSVTVGKINTDENMEITNKYNIMTIPTFILFIGGEIAESVNGVQNRKVLQELIDKHL